MRLTLPCAGCLVLAVIGVVSGCSPRFRPVDPAYRTEIEAWRRKRLERLKAEDGWLTLVGLYWLHPGENSFGSAPDSDVVLGSAGLPARAGDFVVGAERTVTVRTAPGAGVTCAGQAVSERWLRTDAGGAPDVLEHGRLRFHVIARGDRLAVRVKDPQSPTRTRFPGLEYFPIDPAYRVEARFEPYDPPHRVSFPTAVGTEDSDVVPGLLRFTLNGKELTLEPFGEASKGLFIVFRDRTSGEETYGAGRFLDADPPRNGTVLLDFNRAYSPPCAFTPYATCPLPPPGNILPVAVRAGEKSSGPAH